MSEFTALPIPNVPIGDQASAVRSAIDVPQLSANNSFGGLQKLAIPGPFATDTEASTGGVPDDNLYYRSDGTVRAASHISLDLAFALDKTLTARIGPTPVLTRASTGTFIGSDGFIQSAAIDAPRFDHDPLTGVCKGLLIEEQRTNLALQSENHSSESWSKTGVTVASATNTAPNGSATSNLVSEDLLTGLHRVFQSTDYVTGTSYAISVFLKYAGRQFVAITHPAVASNNLAIFDIQNGSVTLQQSGITASMVQCLNGWWRCVVDGVSSMTSSQSHIIQGSTTGGSLTGSYLGLNGPAFYIYGSQVEAGAFPTSYIPTTTGTAPRSADVCSISDAAFASFYNQTEGTAFVDIQPISGQGFWGIHGNTRSDGGSSLTVTADQKSLNNFVWGPSFSPQANFASAIPPRVRLKSALGIKADDFAASVNGGILTDSGGVVVNTVNRLVLGASGNQGGPQAGSAIFARFRYYRKRLPNAKLQTLTTL